jgi:hypothetical protein
MQVHGLSNSVLNLQHDIIPGIISICIILIKEIFRSLCLYGREINIYLNVISVCHHQVVFYIGQ